VPGDETEASATYAGLAGDVRPGTQILVDDGRVALEVTGIDGPRVRTTVLTGGRVSDHKGLNVPGVRVKVPALTSKDADDLRWALGLRADMIALSFVQGPQDTAPVRQIMDQSGTALPLIAKIEKPRAVSALPEIVEAFHGIMVARGDLGVEFPLEQVPLVQKRAIALARQAAKPVIVATQMLESMVAAPRPTRAEAALLDIGRCDKGDLVVIVAGSPPGTPGRTNALRAHRIGDAIAR
jgi:pyruvate kinase